MSLCLAQDPSSNSSANFSTTNSINNNNNNSPGNNTNSNNYAGNNNNNNNNNIKTAYKKALRADMARTFGCLMRNTSSGNNNNNNNGGCQLLTKSSSFSVRSSITTCTQISTDDCTPATPSSTSALFARALCFSEPSSPNSGTSNFAPNASSLPPPGFGQFPTCSATMLTKHSPFDFEAPVANLRRCVDALMSQSKSASKEWFDISFETLRNFDFEMHRRVGMCESALHPINRDKNRYHTVLANEYSRVKLKSIPNREGSDYINANHIPGSLFGIPHSYIATQAPIPETFGDFWRMIWETDSPLILMLSNEYESGRIKCHKYWPDAGRAQVYDQIEVEAIAQKQSNQDVVIREFRLRQRQLPYSAFSSSGCVSCSSTSDSDYSPENRPRTPTASSYAAEPRSPTSLFHTSRGFFASSSSPFASTAGPPSAPSFVEEKKVIMIQFLSWPDHGVPRDRASIHRFSETVDTIYEQSQQHRLEVSHRPAGPITVHCSAGIGRTGTFIAIHVTLSLLKQHLSQRQSDAAPSSPNYGNAERFKFDIYNIVRKLKIQRIGMVQQKEQFVFCYNMVLDEAERLGLHWSDSSDDDDMSRDLETTILSSLSSRQLRELNYVS